MSTPSAAPAPTKRVSKGLLQLAGPLILSFWFRSLFQWVDTVYASTIDGLGDASIAAIGLTMPFEFMMIACWVGTSNSLTSRLAAAMGARQGAKIAQLLSTTRRIVLLLAALFLLVSAGVWFFAGSVGLDPDVARQFQIYGTVLLAGSSFTTFWSILPDSIVKAHHDMKTTMWAGIASTLTNLVLNTLFLFVFDWGIFGIALATVLGRIGGLAYSLVRAAALERARLQEQGDQVPGLFERPFAALAGLAVPAGLSFVFMAFESFAFNGLLASSDSSAEYLAAWSILDRAGRFLVMPIIAMGVATLPLVARLLGSGDLGRVRAELRRGQLAALAFVLLFVTPLAVFAGPAVARTLTDSPAAAELARLGMFCLPLGILFGAPLFLIRPAFEGMQLARPGLVLSALRTVVLTVPLGVLGFRAAPALGVEPLVGLMFAAALGAGFSSLVAWIWLRRQLAEFAS